MLHGLALDADDKASAGHASPDTSTEFEFSVAAGGSAAGAGGSGGGAAQRLAGVSAASDPIYRQVATLLEMFPNVGADCIRHILHNCSGDIEKAANQLSDRPLARSASNSPFVANAGAPPGAGASPAKAKASSTLARMDKVIFHDWDMAPQGVQYYMVIGYLGTGWAGFQFNENNSTGQGALFRLLYDMEAVKSPRPHEKYTFTASRTDKGVHAVCLMMQTPLRQIMYGRENEFVNRINLKIQERGAADKCMTNMRVFAVMMTPRELLNSHDLLDIRDNTCRINSNHLIVSRTYWYIVPSYVLSKGANGGESRKDVIMTRMQKHRLTKEQRDGANLMLSAYIGRTDFRAFTDSKRLNEYLTQDAGGTEREVLKCEIMETVTKNGYEFAMIEITGDRFMYHQIRLMMGLAFLAIQADLSPSQSVVSVLGGKPLPGKCLQLISEHVCHMVLNRH
jgi:tRNA pseudouridine(38-40) synthase